MVPATTLLLFLLGLAGPSLAFAQPAYKVINVTNGGAIRGTVTLKGEIPKMLKMDVTQDNKTCGRMKESPQLSIGKKHGVANTFIFIDSIHRGKAFTPLPAYTLHQHQCEYSPHAMLVPVGVQLEIVNDDPILHNVHTYLDGELPKTLFNIAQPIKGLRMKSKPMAKPGLVLATCDAGHPWMIAHIMVMDHPYYAITDANGGYVIENIPPGTYSVKLWHEGVAIASTVMEKGKISKYNFEAPYEEVQEATVHPEGTTVVNFELVLR